MASYTYTLTSIQLSEYILLPSAVESLRPNQSDLHLLISQYDTHDRLVLHKSPTGSNTMINLKNYELSLLFKEKNVRIQVYDRERNLPFQVISNPPKTFRIVLELRR